MNRESRSWSDLYPATLGWSVLYFDAFFLIVTVLHQLGQYGSQQIPLALLIATPLVVAVVAIPAVLFSMTVSKWIASQRLARPVWIALLVLPVVIYGVCWYLLALNER